MSLQDEIYKRIKEEISLDPDRVGYSGKTDDEIMVLLNSPIAKEVVIIQYHPAPINKILSGLAKAPNIVEKQDVVNSKDAQVDAADTQI